MVGAVDAAAVAAGIAPGMTLAHARMLMPELAAADADPAADLAGLARLAVWCQKHYSPLTAPAPPSGLWLDVTGCTPLWTSEESMLADIVGRFARAGFAARAAMADTPGAAYAVSAFRGLPVTVVPPGQAVAAARSLPVAALRLPDDTVEGLERLGLNTIGDVMRAPRAQLALRFGAEPGRRLDQLTGAIFEPIEPLPAPEAVRRRLSFVEPILTPEALRIAIERLVGLVCQDLEGRGLGARRLDLVSERVDARHQAIRIGLARPTRVPRHLLRLLAARIEQIEPGFGIEAMALSVALAEPMRPEAIGSLVERDPDIRDVAVLVDALVNRLGPGKLYRIEPVESDVPERSFRRIPPLAPPTGKTWPADLPRPARLFERPEPVETVALMPDEPPTVFFWREQRHVVRRADGPERIHGEWWRADRETDAVREYFRVEDDAGSRFWLFRTGIANDARWFLHGLFG
jgi:protein ImuB